MTTSSNKLWIGTLSNGLHVSTDYGNSFNKVEINGLGFGITTLEAYENFILVGNGYDGMFFSKDQGFSWNRLPIPTSIYSMSKISFTESVFYIFKSEGTYVSINQGDSWSLLSSNITSNSLVELGDKKFMGYNYGIIETSYFNEFTRRNIGLDNSNIHQIYFSILNLTTKTDTELYKSSDLGELS